jgi:hypothetical protein
VKLRCGRQDQLIRIASMLRGYLQSNYRAPTAVSISQAPEVQD